MIWFITFILITYAILIIALAFGFAKADEFKPKNLASKTSFSVIIPFRNEAKNLPDLLKSISLLNYPKELIEFIFVNDASSDDSVEIISNNISCQVKRSQNLKLPDCDRGNILLINNVRRSNSPKKDAITIAISIAKNNWIVTTDADCILPENWLKAFDDFIQVNHPKMIVAPVNYVAENNFLEQFQLLDFMSLQGTTIGGFGINFPFMCNGANLGYKKEDFLKLNGFEGNNTIASGDDVFLFEKFLESDKKSVQFLKSEDAMVITFSVKTWKDLINQRIRWASKTSRFKNYKIKLIGLLVFLVNLITLFSLFYFDNFIFAFLPITAKIIIDLCLFLPTINFYQHKKTCYKWYLFCGIFYPFFSVFVVFKAVFFKYNWKGRKFKK
ncbi:glycosyltransferase [Polaribacter aestuariivivens]|uniref:Glycosyltransferase n=1 Tax=Polaribacter aestuariivivens TaxID=2304626 RepID=A0A5S3NAL0_9FLAO|nr:glycosyltransferase [Polaribacter aestuariivivens]TMM32300.1 glycosyltransferase [Polaribacter aestuariivivens]